MDEKQRGQVAAQLPYLRRYARALAGSQERGDEVVRLALQQLLAQSGTSSGPIARADLFRCLHNVRDRVPVPPPKDRTVADPGPPPREVDIVQRRVEERVGELPTNNREALLLVHTEGFSHSEAAYILGVSTEGLSVLLEEAWVSLKGEDRARVLIIEDEVVIALDVAGIVTEMGHQVVGIAARSDQAVELARKERPNLILADIQLEDGSTGVLAVEQILRNAEVPVVFVTAYPERLLTGERIEPAFIVSKPFEHEVLQIAVSQALFCAASPG